MRLCPVLTPPICSRNIRLSSAQRNSSAGDSLSRRLLLLNYSEEIDTHIAAFCLDVLFSLVAREIVGIYYVISAKWDERFLPRYINILRGAGRLKANVKRRNIGELAYKGNAFQPWIINGDEGVYFKWQCYEIIHQRMRTATYKLQPQTVGRESAAVAITIKLSCCSSEEENHCGMIYSLAQFSLCGLADVWRSAEWSNV